MRRYLAISIMLICLMKVPWQGILSNNPASHAAYMESSSTTALVPTGTVAVDQNNTPTVVPPTEKPIKTPRINPTHAPRPTAPPTEIPPPTDRRLLDSMILFGVIASLTIVFGLWTNRQRINPR